MIRIHLERIADGRILVTLTAGHITLLAVAVSVSETGGSVVLEVPDE
jgi:hypothetical protein